MPSQKKQSKIKKLVGFFNPKTLKGGIALFALVFAIGGGGYFVYRSFAATGNFFVYEGTSAGQYVLWKSDETGKNKTKISAAGVMTRVSISPDKSKLAYINTNTTKLSVIDLNGNILKDFSSLKPKTEFKTVGKWSPNGRYLAAYGSDSEGWASLTFKNLYIIDTREKKIIARVDSDDQYGKLACAEFGKDSSKLIYTDNSGSNRKLFLMNLDGTKKQIIANDIQPWSCPFFSPDYSKILYSGRWGYNSANQLTQELYTIKRDGTDRKLIKRFDSEREMIDLDDWSNAWSRDGKYIVYKKAYEPLTSSNGPSWVNVVVLNLENGVETTLTSNNQQKQNEYSNVGWTPYGKIFYTMKEKDSYNWNLYTVRPSGSDKNLITKISGGENYWKDWAGNY